MNMSKNNLNDELGKVIDFQEKHDEKKISQYECFDNLADENNFFNNLREELKKERGYIW